MSRSSGRGQVDPIAALVAVAAVGVGLSLYAAATSQSLVDRRGPTADSALDRVHDRLAPNGIVTPGRLSNATDRWGRSVNVTLRTATDRWTAGPEPPASVASARRRVSVALGPTRVRPGRLEVVVW